MNDTRPSTQSGYQVVIPQLGLTMKEASIVEWLQSDGAWVEKGQPLFTLENEKSVVEVEAPASGRLRIHVESGVTVPVLHPVAVLEGAGHVAAFHAVFTEEATETINTTVTNVMPVQDGYSVCTEKVAASPRARIAAREKGIDLMQIRGSGIRGMITLRDLDRAAIYSEKPVYASPLARKVAEEVKVNLNHVDGSGPRGRIMRGDVEKVLKPDVIMEERDLLAGLTGLRAIIAERLSQSWRERPHVTLTTEVDVSHLVSFRKEVNALMEKDNHDASGTIKISYNALLVKLVAECLFINPTINVSLTREGIKEHDEIHVGIAVDTGRGLMVPVIKDASEKNLLEIQESLQILAKRAVEGRSSPEDLEGGTFTITNLGAYGIDAFTPIINPPESAILGVGRILPRPIGLDGKIVLRETVVLSLTFDHRLIDGAPAAYFMQKLSELLADPPKSLLLGVVKGETDELD